VEEKETSGMLESEKKQLNPRVSSPAWLKNQRNAAYALPAALGSDSHKRRVGEDAV
jgi:hypothetical protein